MENKEDIIAKLELEPLYMEGGYFKVSYVSKEYEKMGRPVGSAIYYLLTPDNFSRLHLHDADELFHFYAGDPVTQIYIDQEKKIHRSTLGPDILSGHTPQWLVPAKLWQSVFYAPENEIKYGWSLLGATVHPGFNQESFQRANTITLKELGLDHKELRLLL